MRVIHDRHPGHAHALMVLLPGAGQQPEDLLRAGFADAVRARRLAADIAALDFELPFVGQYADGTAVGLLRQELSPLLEQGGYRERWLCGISIGGAVAADYANRYDVDGLCLLAPYPGSGITVNAIRRAGGLRQWTPAGNEDSDFALWRWLRQNGHDARRLHLGYGRQDRFSASLDLMREALAPECVDTVEGSHDLPSWRLLWDNFLGRLASRHDWIPANT